MLLRTVRRIVIFHRGWCTAGRYFESGTVRSSINIHESVGIPSCQILFYTDFFYLGFAVYLGFSKVLDSFLVTGCRVKPHVVLGAPNGGIWSVGSALTMLNLKVWFLEPATWHSNMYATCVYTKMHVISLHYLQRNEFSILTTPKLVTLHIHARIYIKQQDDNMYACVHRN